MAQISGLSAWFRAIPKLRLWTSRSIRALSQHASVVRFSKKLEVNWATDPQMALPQRRFEAFPCMLAVNPAVQQYSRVHTSKTYGNCLGHCNYQVFSPAGSKCKHALVGFTRSCFHVCTSETFGFYMLDRHGIVGLGRGRSLHVVGWGQHRIFGPLQWPRPMSFEALASPPS